MKTPPELVPPLSFDRVAAFVRLVTHDVRNGLNALDLQSAYLAEIAEQPEVKQELGKLREIVAHVTRSMQALSASTAEVRPTTLAYPARDLATAFHEKARSGTGKPIEWKLELGAEEIELDFNLLAAALEELLRNASHFYKGDGPIRFSARREKGNVVFEVTQPCAEAPPGDPMRWGREPLVTTRRGGFGLGLFHVRRILDALGGDWEARFDKAAAQMKVRISFPVVA